MHLHGGNKVSLILKFLDDVLLFTNSQRRSGKAPVYLEYFNGTCPLISLILSAVLVQVSKTPQGYRALITSWRK
jgi:hypothetical protein